MEATDTRKSTAAGGLNIDFSKGGGIVIAFLLLCVVLSILTPRFLSVENLMIVTRQTVFVMVIGFAMTFVIGMGGIDLSVGATLAICGVVTAKLLVAGVNVWIAMLAALVLGTFIGAFNGFLIAKLGMTDFIATLGVMTILRGLILLLTGGIPIYGLQDPTLQYLAQAFVLGVPVPGDPHRHSVTHQHVPDGQDPLRPVRAGHRLQPGCSPAGRHQHSAGQDLGLRLLRAVRCHLGTDADVPHGGRHARGRHRLRAGGDRRDRYRRHQPGRRPRRAVRHRLGAMVMSVVRNGLNLLNVNVYWHQVVIGTIILLAVGIDVLSQRQWRK